MSVVACYHKPPVFGCPGCIRNVDLAAGEQWLRDNVPPRCEECGGPTQFSIQEGRNLYFECDSRARPLCDHGGAEVTL